MRIIILLGLICVYSPNFFAQESINLADGLVAYYPFAGTPENRVQVEPRVVLKGSSWTTNRFGDEESALIFDGVEDQLLIPPHPDMNMTQYLGYTVSLWIKPRDDNSGCIMLRDKDFGIKWNGLDKPLTLFNGMSGGFPDGKFDKWSSKDWYNIILKQDSRNLSLYINGELDVQLPLANKPQVEDSNPIYLGKHPYIWGGYTGKIDDLVLYSRALSDYEILMMSQVENVPLESTIEAMNHPVSLENLEGTVWQGVITQPGNEFGENYAFWLKFNKIEKGILMGYSRIEMQEETAYGVTKVQGLISGGALNFEERQVIRQKNYLGYKWCKKYGNLEYNPQEKSLRGKWYANNCHQGGEVLLFKSNEPFNYHDNRLSKSTSIEDFLEMMKDEDAKEKLKNKVMNLEFEPIHFTLGSADLTKEARQYLRVELVPILQSYPQLLLSIHGHTDDIGDDKVNLELSIARAKSIHNFLIQENIATSRISYQGFGESKPLVPNKSDEARRTNRRVEFGFSL